MGGENAISSGLSILAGILEREKKRGAETVGISTESERLLATLPSEWLKQRQERPAAALTFSNRENADLPETRRATTPGEPGGRRFPIPVVPESERTETWVRAQLNAIFKAVKHCPDCRSLGTLFETVVFATGNPQAGILFVGDAPNLEDEAERKPFVGPAGEKLDQILKAMGVKREDVYISNIVKFRPKKGEGRFQGSGERPPQHDEMVASLPYLRAEIEVVRPKVIVALGRTAAEGLLEKGGSLASFRNGTHSFEGIPVIVTSHPSTLLRPESETNPEQAMIAKRSLWEDMLRVMDVGGLPVTAKQRKYFS